MSTTHAPLTKNYVNQHNCKLVSITLPNVGSQGLILSEQDDGKSIIIEEVIPQSQAEKCGVLAGDVPILLLNNLSSSSISSVCRVHKISYETFLRRARVERPFIFSVLRDTTDKSSDMNQSSIKKGAPSHEKLDGACETTNIMVHENMAINDANIDLMEDYLANTYGGSAAVDDTSAQLAAAVTTQKFTNFTSHVSDTPAARVSSITTNNNSITPGSSMKMPNQTLLRDNITPPQRFVARPSNFGIRDDNMAEDKELGTNVSFYGEQQTPSHGPLTSDRPLIHTNNQKITTHMTNEKQRLDQMVLESSLAELSNMPSDDIDTSLMDIETDKDEDLSAGISQSLSPEYRGEKQAEMSMSNIVQPGPHDVLIGRGGGTNHNPGNKRFRQLVCTRKDEYKSAERSQKPIIAQEIVTAWRAQVPPGRFLKQNESTMLWYDIGNVEAKEKIKQKLRDSNNDDRDDSGKWIPPRSRTNNLLEEEDQYEPADKNLGKTENDDEKQPPVSVTAASMETSFSQNGFELPPEDDIVRQQEKEGRPKSNVRRTVPSEKAHNGPPRFTSRPPRWNDHEVSALAKVYGFVLVDV